MSLQQPLDELTHRRVDPVPVLDDQAAGLFAREAGEPVLQQRQQARARAARRGVSRLRRQADRAARSAKRSPWRELPGSAAASLSSSAATRFVANDTESAPQCFVQRQVQARAGIGAATAFEHLDATGRQPAPELTEDRRDMPMPASARTTTSGLPPAAYGASRRPGGRVRARVRPSASAGAGFLSCTQVLNSNLI